MDNIICDDDAHDDVHDDDDYGCFVVDQLNESVKRMNATTGWGSITITDHHRKEDDNND